MTRDLPLVPVACTLGPADGAERLRRWRALLDSAGVGATRTGGVLEVRFRAGPGVHAELSTLVTAERQCCAFVEWQVTEEDGRSVLLVVADPERPEDGAAIAALFGAA